MSRRRPSPSRSFPRYLGAMPSAIASGLPLPSLPFNSVVRSPLVEVEDHRLWYPDWDIPARTLRRSRAGIILARSQRSRSRASSSEGPRSWELPPPILAFSAPKFVAVCVRRKRRREVLLALGRAGRNRRGRRNQWSSIRC